MGESHQVDVLCTNLGLGHLFTNLKELSSILVSLRNVFFSFFCPLLRVSLGLRLMMTCLWAHSKVGSCTKTQPFLLTITAVMGYPQCTWPTATSTCSLKAFSYVHTTLTGIIPHGSKESATTTWRNFWHNHGCQFETYIRTKKEDTLRRGSSALSI